MSISSSSSSCPRPDHLRPPLTRSKGGQRRVEIVNAVLDLAAGNDPGRITTQMVADRVGITQGALFRHFATKDAMMTAVVAGIAEQLTCAVESGLRSHPEDALRALEAAFMAHVDFLVKTPGAPRVMISEMQNSSSSEAALLAAGLLRRYTALLCGRFTLGVKRKQLRVGLDSRAAAGVFLGTIQGLVLQCLMSGKMDALGRSARPAWKILEKAFQQENGEISGK